MVLSKQAECKRCPVKSFLLLRCERWHESVREPFWLHSRGSPLRQPPLVSWGGRRSAPCPAVPPFLVEWTQKPLAPWQVNRDIWAQGKWTCNKKTTRELSEGQGHLRLRIGLAAWEWWLCLCGLSCFQHFWLYLLGMLICHHPPWGPQEPEPCTSSPKLHSLAQCLYCPGPSVSSWPHQVASQESAWLDIGLISSVRALGMQI